jgi:hypothetical protein
MPKPLLIKLPDHLWAKLQTLRGQGFTASKYIRALLERALAEVPPTFPGQQPVVRQGKPKAKAYKTNKGSRAHSDPKRTGSWQSDGKGGLRR